MKPGAPNPLSTLLWLIMALLSMIIGLYPGLYLLPHMGFSFPDSNFSLLTHKERITLLSIAWNIAFYIHIITGGLALLTGWVQFSERWRLRHPSFHRKAGRWYIIFSLPAALAGIYLALFATGGPVSSAGFGLLGIFWCYTSLMTFINARKNRILQHRRMAFYSYGACFAAVTLRLWLALLLYTGIDFITAYRVVAWLSWLPNIIIADILWRKKYNITTPAVPL